LEKLLPNQCKRLINGWRALLSREVHAMTEIKIKQRGMSLIELMVGLTIGLLLALVASATYLYSKQGFNATSETSQVEENGRFAINLLSRYIQSAGHVMLDPTSKFPDGARDDRLFGCDFGFQSVSPSYNFACNTSAVTGTLPSSSIKTIFETDKPNNTSGNFEGANCIGLQSSAVVVGAVTKTYQVTSYFYISETVVKTEYGTTTMGELSCIPGDLSTGVSASSQPVVPGIVQMDVRYIVGSEASNSRTALSAASVATAASWGTVSAVEICVMAKSVLVGVNDTGRVHTDCKGNNITAEPNAVYRNFRSRINLRNTAIS
jgi:type IV pilus assembly protein PilW